MSEITPGNDEVIGIDEIMKTEKDQVKTAAPVKKKTPASRVILLILGLVILLAILLLGDRIFRNAAGSGNEEQASLAEADAEATAVKPTAAPAATPEAADAAAEPLCGDAARMTFLVIGADTGINSDDTLNNFEGYGEADFIGVVMVDFTDPAIRILKIPQHLWVPIEGLTAAQVDEMSEYFGVPVLPDGSLYTPDEGENGRLNAAYFYSDYEDSADGGQEALAATLASNFDLSVDSFIAIDPAVMVRIVDALDGITLTIPRAIGDFEAGSQQLTGQEALDYARILRLDDEDWLQSDRQEDVLLALMDKLQQPARFIAIPTMIDVFFNDIKTDLTMDGITDLYCLADKITADDIETFSVTPDMYTSVMTTEGFIVMLPDMAEIEMLIEDFLAE